MGSLADAAKKKKVGSGYAEVEKPKGEDGGPGILGQVLHTAQNIAGAAVSIPRSQWQGNINLARQTWRIAHGDFDKLGVRDEEGNLLPQASFNYTQPLVGGMYESARNTGYDYTVYPVRTWLGELDPWETNAYEETSGENTILRALAPALARESKKGNLVGKVVEDVGNLSMAAAGAGIILGKVGTAGTVAAQQAAAGEAAAVSTGEAAAAASTTGEVGARFAAAGERAASGSGLAGRLATSSPRLAGNLQALGEVSSNIGRLGLKYGDPLEMSLRAAGKSIPVVRSGLSTVGDYIRARVDPKGIVFKTTEKLAPSAETLKARATIRGQYVRRAIQAQGDTAEPILAANEAVYRAAKDAGVEMDRRVRTLGDARDILRGREPTRLLVDRDIYMHQDWPEVGESLPKDVSTPQRVAVLEAEDAYRAYLDLYDQWLKEGLNPQDFVDAVNESWVGTPDDLRVFGEDIVAWHNYRNGLGTYAGDMGKLRGEWVRTAATKLQELADRTEAQELTGFGHKGRAPISEHQTPAPYQPREVGEPPLTRAEELGVMPEAVKAEQQTIEGRLAKLTRQSTREQAARVKIARRANVQAAVAEQTAETIQGGATAAEMQRRGAGAQRVATAEQRAAAEATRATRTVNKAERRAGVLGEKASVARTRSAVAAAENAEIKATVAEDRAFDLADKARRSAEKATKARVKAETLGTEEAVAAAEKAQAAATQSWATAEKALDKAGELRTTADQANATARNLSGGETTGVLAEKAQARVAARIGEGPPTAKQLAQARQEAVKRLRTEAATATEKATKAAETGKLHAKASEAIGAAEQKRGTGARAKAIAGATEAEKAAEAAIRSTSTKTGVQSKARRIFVAEGRTMERSSTLGAKVRRTTASIERVKGQFARVPEELAKTAQTKMKEVHVASIVRLKKIATEAGHSGGVGRVRRIVNLKGDVRLSLSGALYEVTKQYGKEANDAVTTAIVEAEGAAGGVELSAMERYNVAMDALEEAGIDLTPQHVDQLELAARVEDAVTLADRMMASGLADGTWVLTPGVIGEMLDQIPRLPDDIRTKLRTQVAKFAVDVRKELSFQTKQVGAGPGFTRQAMMASRRVIRTVLDVVDEMEAKVPGSGAKLAALIDDMPTSMRTIEAAGWDPSHFTGGLAPEHVQSVEGGLSERVARSERQKRTDLAERSVNGKIRMAADQEITKHKTAAFAEAVDTFAQDPTQIPELAALGQRWTNEHGGAIPSADDWAEIVAEHNRTMDKAATTAKGQGRREGQNRWHVVMPDANTKTAFTRAQEQLRAARKQLELRKLERATKLAGSQDVTSLDAKIAVVEQQLADLSDAFDRATTNNKPRVVLENTWKGLSDFQKSSVTAPPLTIQWIGQFNRWMKTWMLALSPKWWANNAVGGAVMAQVYGGVPLHRVMENTLRMRKLTSQFGMDVETLLEQGVLDVNVRDLLNEWGAAIPEGLSSEAGVRGVRVVEGNLTRREAELMSKTRAQGGEFIEPTTRAGQILRGNRFTRARQAAADASFRVNANMDNIYRAAVYLDKLEQTAFRYLRYEPETGYRFSREVPKELKDLTPNEVEAIAEKALDEVNKAMGDFSAMSPVERRIIRHIIPFWSWIRHSNTAFARMAWTAPHRMLWMANLAELGNDPTLTERERSILFGMIPIDDKTYLRLGNLVSPIEDPTEGTLNPVWTGPSTLRSMSPAINAFIAATTGINVSRGTQATRPDAGFQGRFNPLLDEPGNLAGYLFGRLPGPIRGLRDVVEGPGPRYDTGQRKEGGVFQGPVGGRLGALARGFGIPVPEEVDLEAARGGR